jgi:hypothetical protein
MHNDANPTTIKKEKPEKTLRATFNRSKNVRNEESEIAGYEVKLLASSRSLGQRNGVNGCVQVMVQYRGVACQKYWLPVPSCSSLYFFTLVSTLASTNCNGHPCKLATALNQQRRSATIQIDCFRCNT